MILRNSYSSDGFKNSRDKRTPRGSLDIQGVCFIPCTFRISVIWKLEVLSKFSEKFGKELCFLKSIVSFSKSKYFLKYLYDLIFPKKRIFTNVEILVFLYLKIYDNFVRTKHDMNKSKPILD